jgi:lipopolysaccharide export LptBFGC system permease protein LptF
MKTLDRYVVRSFLFTMLLLFVVMMLLRIVADLFVNIDEFAEVETGGLGGRILHVGRYYGYQSLTYFVELGGVIIAAAATFSLARMNHSNELTAMLASGVSLYRVTFPIVICSMVMGGLIILDQEILIPNAATQLSLGRDEAPETTEFEVRFLTDGANSVWYAKRYNDRERTMRYPVVLVRNRQLETLARISGSRAVACKLDEWAGWMISDAHLAKSGSEAEIWRSVPSTRRICSNITPQEFLERAKLEYRKQENKDVSLEEITRVTDVALQDAGYGLKVEARQFVPEQLAPEELPGGKRAAGEDGYGGKLEDAAFTFRTADGQILGRFVAKLARWKLDHEAGGGFWELTDATLFYPSDMTPEDLVLRQSSNWLDYMSTSALARLVQLRRVGNVHAAQLTKHVRFTAPLNNLVMLLLALPFILSRERNIKASAAMCLITVGTFFLLVYICRHMGFSPLLAAWLPIFIFGPAAVIMLDLVKT